MISGGLDRMAAVPFAKLIFVKNMQVSFKRIISLSAKTQKMSTCGLVNSPALILANLSIYSPANVDSSKYLIFFGLNQICHTVFIELNILSKCFTSLNMCGIFIITNIGQMDIYKNIKVWIRIELVHIYTQPSVVGCHGWKQEKKKIATGMRGNNLVMKNGFFLAENERRLTCKLDATSRTAALSQKCGCSSITLFQERFT